MYLVWRVVMTGFCMLLFGMGGLLNAALIFPLFRLFAPSVAARERWSRYWLHLCLRVLLTLIELFWLAKFHVIGRERLDAVDRAIIVANHPTLIDVVILFSMLPTADCIVKAAMWDNPATWASVRAAGYIRNDGQPAEVIETCVARLSKPCKLVVFPEGTRSPPGGLAPLSRGAARIAIRSQIPLIPVTIHADPPMLTNATRWYKLPRKRSVYHLRVGMPIHPPAPASATEHEAALSRELTDSMRKHFEESVFHGRV